jgi:hypothetical protein
MTNQARFESSLLINISAILVNTRVQIIAVISFKLMYRCMKKEGLIGYKT